MPAVVGEIYGLKMNPLLVIIFMIKISKMKQIIIYGVNKCNGTLVMLLFNAGLDVLMKILSFTCRA